MEWTGDGEARELQQNFESIALSQQHFRNIGLKSGGTH